MKGDKIEAEHGEYNLKTQEGTFWAVKGSSPARVVYEPWLLRTTNPFYFEGEWAERHHDRYVIHNGFLTDCLVPNPWWTLTAKQFDVVPDDRAIAHRATFRFRKYPAFYLPAFYRPLGRKDRQSGFLTPNIGNSSQLGFMLGEGYYWAINQSYDATYRLQYFSNRGYAHTADFRGKPTQKSDFDFQLYGVNDRGLPLGNGRRLDEGGLQFEVTAKTELPGGWVGKLDYRYLSSYLFRQSFTQSFNEAIFSEVNSVGYLQRYWRDYTVNIGFNRQQLFESTASRDVITIQKLPSVDFNYKDIELFKNAVPVWASLDSNFSLLRRQEPTFQTSNAVDREDVAPHVITAFHFAGFDLIPGVTMHATRWGDSQTAAGVLNQADISRKAADATVDLIAPPLERFFPSPKWLGQKLKHVIEPRLSYRYITGIDNFNQILRFDETDLLSNTNQLKLSIINRLLVKNKQGRTLELVTWEVAAERFFDPTFGGALVTGRPNLFAQTEDVTPYTFLTRPRDYSPVDSNLRIGPSRLRLTWRFDYDPLFKRLTNDSIDVGYSITKKTSMSVGFRELNPDPIILGFPNAAAEGGLFQRQLTMTVRYGNSLGRGWNFGSSAYYDVNLDQLDYLISQATYNTDCCGFNLEVRRFALGVRNENQFLFSFVIANVGAFGNFRRQDRIF